MVKNTYYIFAAFPQTKFQTKRSSNLFFMTDFRREAACFSWFHPKKSEIEISVYSIKTGDILAKWNV